MASYYSQLEETIRENEERLRYLNSELNGLRAIREDIPNSEYHRRSTQIMYQLDKEQRQLEHNKNMLYNYNSARRNYERIKELKSMLTNEADPSIRVEISYEIGLREASLSRNLGNLTDELAQETKTLLETGEEMTDNNSNDEKESIDNDENEMKM